MSLMTEKSSAESAIEWMDTAIECIARADYSAALQAIEIARRYTFACEALARSESRDDR